MNNPDRKRLLVIGSVVLAVVIVVGVVAATVSNHNKNNANKNKVTDITTGKGDYYDPNSHDVVSNPAGKTPENYGATADAPVYLGVDSLLNNSLSDTQVGDYKFAIYQYFHTNKIKATEVSVAVDTIVAPWNPDSTTQNMTFNIVVNRKDTYKVSLDYFDLNSIDLRLSDNTGKQLYDSGTVTNQNLY